MLHQEEAVIAFPTSLAGMPIVAELDSGATGGLLLTISSALQSRQNFQKIGEQKVSAYGGRFVKDVVLVPHLQVGGLAFTDVPAGVAPPDARKTGAIDATFHLDLLRYASMQVEWDSRRMRFLLPGEFADGLVSTIEYREDVGFGFAQVSICGETHKLIIDTGMEDALSVDRSKVSLGCAKSTRTSLSSVGAGGDRVYNDAVVINEVTIGRREFSGLISSIQDGDNPLSQKQIAGAIGYGLLRQSNFLLDVAGGRIAFYGSRRKSRPADVPTIGIQFVDAGDRLDITNVMDGSPAAASPISKGDKICALNGTQISALAGDYRAINPPVGTALAITLCAGAKVDLVAADFLGIEVYTPSSQGLSENAQTGKLTSLYHSCDNWVKADPAIIASCSAVIEAPHLTDYFKTLARINRGQLHLEAFDYDDAIADFDMAMEYTGPNAALLLLQSEAAIKKMDFANAQVSLDKARALEPDNGEVHIVSSKLFLAQKRIEDGVRAAREAVRTDAENADAHVQLALALQASKALDEACQAIAKAASLSPEHHAVAGAEASIVQERGRPCLP